MPTIDKALTADRTPEEKLASRARQIRLVANRLEQLGRKYATGVLTDQELVKVRRDLGFIRSELDGLFQVFGKGDR